MEDHKSFYVDGKEIVPISFVDFYTDCLKLAKMVHESSFQYDLVVPILRGGFVPFYALTEFLKLKKADPPSYHTVKIESYNDDNSQGRIVEIDRIDMDGLLARLDPNKKVLVFEDIVDTGKSMELFHGRMDESAVAPPRENIITVAPYFKPEVCLPGFEPDKYVRTFRRDQWVSMPAELSGLPREIIELKGYSTIV